MTSDTKGKKRVLFSAGGTGGHLFPAVAAAQEISGRGQGAAVMFIVSDNPLEMESLR